MTGTVRLVCALLLVVHALFGGAAFAVASGTAPPDPSHSLLIVNKSTNELAFFRDGVLERVFPVATGKKVELTPEGVFPIVNKIKNRPYYKESIPGGDPDNPLGDRWLGLHVGDTYGTTYAIHGNNNPSSIGKYVSAGCIRMRNDDIRWLFDRIALKTKVWITSSELSFEALAEKRGYDLEVRFPGTFEIQGETVAFDELFLLYRGTTYVPFRSAAERLGGTVRWDSERRLAVADVGGTTIEHRPFDTVALVNGELSPLRAPSRVRDGTVMVPVRDIAEMLGWELRWDADTRTVHWTKPAEAVEPAAEPKPAPAVEPSAEPTPAPANEPSTSERAAGLPPAPAAARERAPAEAWTNASTLHADLALRLGPYMEKTFPVFRLFISD